MDADATPVTLSQEELFYLLAHLKLSTFVGIDTTVLATLTARQRHEMLQAGGRALQARGLLHTLQDDVIADPSLAVMLRAAALSDPLLVVEAAPTGRAIQIHLYSFARSTWITHKQPHPGLHTFSSALDGHTLRGTLEALLDVSVGRSSRPTIHSLEHASQLVLIGAFSAVRRLALSTFHDEVLPDSLATLLSSLGRHPALKHANLIAEGLNIHRQVLLYDGASYWIANASPPSATARVTREDVSPILTTLLSSDTAERCGS